MFLLVGCPKLGAGDDKPDSAAEAPTVVPVATATASVAATAEPSADPKRDPRGCKPGQLFVKLTEVPGGVETQKCRQICGQGLATCPSGQSCTGSSVPGGGSPVCVAVLPTAGACKPGDRPVQGSAATLFSCETPCKADADCPRQRPTCSRELSEDATNRALKFRFCTDQGTPPPSTSAATPTATPSATPSAPATAVTPATAAKVKCVLPSPPPCAAPHVASPKGLCQVPCANGSCAACGGTCQKGFCVGG